MSRESQRPRIASGFALAICFAIAVVVFAALDLAAVAVAPGEGNAALISAWPARVPPQFPAWQSDTNHRYWATTYNSFGKCATLAVVTDRGNTSSYECWTERTGWPFAAFRLERFRTQLPPSAVSPGSAPSVTLLDRGSGLASGARAPAFLETGTPFGIDRIPVQPVWGGLAADLAILWIAVIFPFMVDRVATRAVRCWQKLCPTCGYERRDLGRESPCPECGSPHTIWPC